ncbi:MAG TPA: alpha/beta fold hydrolase [Acidimicrobiales bacterium]|nr:alpha/beta fold hydrolase [Acidimicrobiales bacterium]
MRTTVDVPDDPMLASVWAAAEYRVIGDGVFYPDLVRMRDSIRSWDGWLTAWSSLADEYEELAREAETAGNVVTAGEHYWQASLSVHFGQFLWFHRPAEKADAQRRKVELYRKAAPHLQPPAERLEIECDGLRMPAFLRTPPPGGTVSPCVVLIGGLDSTKEESRHFEDSCLARGVATLVFDGPGQGESYAQRALVPDFERYVSAVVDVLQTRPEIDPERIGVLGRSLGGYYAARSAAHEPRLKACAIFGALANIEHLDEIPPQTQLGFEFVTALEDREQARARAKAYINLGDLPSEIRQPLFVLHGALDIIVPVAQAQELYEMAPSEDKRLWIIPDGIHCAHNRFHRVRRPMADWLASRLGASPPSSPRA